MLPGGMNPRDMKKMMKRMGVSVEEIEASEVVIKTPSYDLVIDSPQVMRMVVSGQSMFQISGNARKESGHVVVEFNADDVSLVASQAGVSEDAAKAALEKAGGDLAQAILELKKGA
ncbi:Nascent polypeptide-associated complex protein [uncultured archaeon]|nr:Nascent polypeptide-associated complex protein [uncultured archaeon]